MKNHVRSIRPFVGAKNFDLSRQFYQDIGFEEKVISAELSVFSANSLSFYLQNAYVKEWIDNLMMFIEVDNVEEFWKFLDSLNLPGKYPGVRLSPIRYDSWGDECFLHDPSGVLWHFGRFK